MLHNTTNHAFDCSTSFVDDYLRQAQEAYENKKNYLEALRLLDTYDTLGGKKSSNYQNLRSLLCEHTSKNQNQNRRELFVRSSSSSSSSDDTIHTTSPIVRNNTSKQRGWGRSASDVNDADRQSASPQGRNSPFKLPRLYRSKSLFSSRKKLDDFEGPSLSSIHPDEENISHSLPIRSEVLSSQTRSIAPRFSLSRSKTHFDSQDKKSAKISPVFSFDIEDPEESKKRFCRRPEPFHFSNCLKSLYEDSPIQQQSSSSYSVGCGRSNESIFSDIDISSSQYSAVSTEYLESQTMMNDSVVNTSSSLIDCDDHATPLSTSTAAAASSSSLSDKTSPDVLAFHVLPIASSSSSRTSLPLPSKASSTSTSHIGEVFARPPLVTSRRSSADHLMFSPLPSPTNSLIPGKGIVPTIPFATPTRTELRASQLESLDVSSHVEACVALGIRLVVIDFDMTLISIHTHSDWKQGAAALQPHIRPVFRILVPELLKRGICIGIATLSGQIEMIEELLLLTLGSLMENNRNVFVRGSNTTMTSLNNDADGDHHHTEEENSKKRDHIQATTNAMSIIQTEEDENSQKQLKDTKTETPPSMNLSLSQQEEEDKFFKKGKQEHIREIRNRFNASNQNEIQSNEIMFIDDERDNIDSVKDEGIHCIQFATRGTGGNTCPMAAETRFLDTTELFLREKGCMPPR